MLAVIVDLPEMHIPSWYWFSLEDHQCIHRGMEGSYAAAGTATAPAVSLTGDTGYNAGELLQLLKHRNITASVPIHPLQESNMDSTGGFDYRGHHLAGPQGKILNRGGFHNRDGVDQYVARQKDCRACPVKADCVPPGQ